LGRVPSVILVVLLALCIMGGVSVVVVSQVKSLAADLPRHKEEIVTKIASVRDVGKDTWLGSVHDTVKDIAQRLDEAVPAGPETILVKVESSQLPILQLLVSPAIGVLPTTGLVVVLVIFMLIQREDLRNRLLRLVKDGNLMSMTKAADDAAR